jgi:hypothetical protein
MMKKLLLFTLFSLLSYAVAAQNSPQAAFDEANTVFENGNVSKALQLYKDIEQSGQVSGALYLNIGITAVQIDSMGLAKYYFLKAKNFNSTSEKANTGLEYVNSQFSRQSAVLPKLPWDRAVHWLIEGPSAPGVFIIGFLITISGLILLYLCWFNKITLGGYFSYILSLIIVGSSLAGLSFYVDYVDQRYDEGVLITNSQRVTQSPNPDSPLVSIAYEGYDITVDQWKSAEQENWLYIRLGNGQYGWIPDSGVKVL